MKGKLLAFGVSLLALATVGVNQQQTKALDSSRDCDQFAVIRCGALTAEELRAEYDSNNTAGANGHTGAQADIKQVFSGMGISRAELQGTFRQGIVRKDGTVEVDGKVVATGAMMAARGLGGNRIAGTNAEKVSVSAMGDAQTALVRLDQNGTFRFAVMKPCGNPVTATAKEQPKPQQTTPTPPPAPESNPAVDIVKHVDTDKKFKQVNANVEFTYKVDVRNTGNVDLNNVVVTDTPDQGITLLSVTPPSGKIENNVFHYTIPKLLKGETRTFVLTAKVPVAQAGRLVNTVCVDAPAVPGTPDKCSKAEVEVPATPVPGKIDVCLKNEDRTVRINENEFNDQIHSRDFNDCQEEEAPAELPHTGPVDTIMSVFGAMSMVGASAYYAASRRHASL